MKRLIRCSAIMIVITMLFCFMTAVHAADNYFELNGFTFDINSEGKATIHDYTGSDTDVAIPDTLLRAPVIAIGDYAFYGKEITSVSFNAAPQLSSIGTYSFYGCSSLSEVCIPSGVELSYGSFQGCTALGSLTIDEGIGEIPEQCFYGCSSLTEISLPDSVTVIGTRAFGECDGIRYLYLSDYVTSIGPNAFEGDEDLIIRCSKDAYAAQYAKDNNIKAEYPYEYLIGDADGNEDVSVYDVTIIQRYLAHLLHGYDEELINLRGDVNNNDELDTIDVTLIQRFLAHMDTAPYTIGETAWGYSSAETV